MEQEIWKDIEGYEGKYQVSNYGNVRSLMYHNTKGIKRISSLKPATDGKGYLRCALSKNNILTTFKVHRLVAQAFIPNPLNLPQVNHLNGDKQDNRVENLEWCTNSMNQKHAYKIGLTPHHATKHYGVIIKDAEKGIEIKFRTLKEASLYVGVNWITIKKWSMGDRPHKVKHWKYSVELIK